jgi:hypothetical protein
MLQRLGQRGFSVRPFPRWHEVGLPAAGAEPERVALFKHDAHARSFLAIPALQVVAEGLCEMVDEWERNGSVPDMIELKALRDAAAIAIAAKEPRRV